MDGEKEGLFDFPLLYRNQSILAAYRSPVKSRCQFGPYLWVLLHGLYKACAKNTFFLFSIIVRGPRRELRSIFPLGRRMFVPKSTEQAVT
jgi:hypothetical protein